MTYAVILAGGVGSRFWPFSRELEPKQFMKIIGEASLLQATIQRLKGVVDPACIYIITNNIYFYEVKAQVAKFGIPDVNIILEPQGKNTAPAVGVCAKLISRIDKDAVLLVLPSDHYIKNISNFKKTVKKAIVCASKDLLVTIGIKPNAASTGYGYIKVDGKKNGYITVEKFLEKPDLNKAKKYFKDKRFFWNSGMFTWKAAVFLEEAKKYLPKLYASLRLINSAEDIPKVWPRIEAVSVDYGIMERSRRIALIPASFYWTDLGSWDALAEIFPKDKKGNISSGDTLDVDSNGVCVFSKGNRLVSTIGVNNMVIADTPDALLVCDRSRTQDVKQLVERLKTLKRKEHQVHLTQARPWGSFTVLQQGIGFKIKLIEIMPGKRLSLQRHRSRAEHWVVVSGMAKITSAGKVSFARSNESVYIPKDRKHRLENPLRIPLKVVEVQTGVYLEEDDIERFEDDFKKECR
ncbi:MAG: mannose-1-phosphate guanylyltransferase/mannose-6-phosphate isomerase [Candidatus Omnitrophica bacterium]|nr:mannose-1-phosphate guanylyltransferase/mannose-6-phosphate isomerase [Candidatus Omnitrophota bacterium]MBU1923222.1 mannose-1-phosphate guanylyltransferase/mannose-6-phosphate isomerase [Candidatus Omnitrophota bacterium]